MLYVHYALYACTELHYAKFLVTDWRGGYKWIWHRVVVPARVARAGIFKTLWSPGIDAKASIPPAYVAWRAGTITLFLLGA